MCTINAALAHRLLAGALVVNFTSFIVSRKIGLLIKIKGHALYSALWHPIGLYWESGAWLSYTYTDLHGRYSDFFRPVARIDFGKVQDPQKWTFLDPRSGLFERTSPLNHPTKNPFLTYFVTKSGHFSRFRVVRRTPAPLATGLDFFTPLWGTQPLISTHWFWYECAAGSADKRGLVNGLLMPQILGLKESFLVKIEGLGTEIWLNVRLNGSQLAENEKKKYISGMSLP